MIVQNGNAYVEGIGAAFDPMKPFWANRTPETEKPVRELLTIDTTIFQYTHGVKDAAGSARMPTRWISTSSIAPAMTQSSSILLHNYQSNVALYDRWHEYFRKQQPKMLIVWGKNDPFFTVAGAKAYLRDVPNAELHLIDTGHFALEDSSGFIAERMREFLGQGGVRKSDTLAA